MIKERKSIIGADVQVLHGKTNTKFYRTSTYIVLPGLYRSIIGVPHLRRDFFLGGLKLVISEINNHHIYEKEKYLKF